MNSSHDLDPGDELGKGNVTADGETATAKITHTPDKHEGKKPVDRP